MVVAISYERLEEASQGAAGVSYKYAEYSDKILTDVINKLNNYSGPQTGYVSSALASARAAYSKYQNLSARWSNFSLSLHTLGETCQDVDTAVSKRVSDLCDNFRTSEHIASNIVENFIAHLLVNVENTNWISRRVTDTVMDIIEKAKSLKDQIEVWLRFEGGSDLLGTIDSVCKDLILGVVAVVVAALGVVFAVESGGTSLVIAGAVLVLLGTVIVTKIGQKDSLIEIISTFQSAWAYQHGDAALACRYAQRDTVSDWLRHGFLNDTEDKTKFNQWYNGRRVLACIFDIADAAGNVMILAGNAMSLYGGLKKDGISSLAPNFESDTSIIKFALEGNGYVNNQLDIQGELGTIFNDVNRLCENTVELTDMIMSGQSFEDIWNAATGKGGFLSDNLDMAEDILRLDIFGFGDTAADGIDDVRRMIDGKRPIDRKLIKQIQKLQK